MTELFNFEKLKVYQNTLEIIQIIYLSSKKWPKDEQFGLINQCRRACVSIALNIAEGSSRTKKDFMHFLSISRGSCYEVCACLNIAKTLGYISDQEYNLIYDKLLILSKMITSLKKSLTK